MALGTMLATHAIRRRQLCREGFASPTRAMGAATILMLVSGCGLITLMFHSRRKGHDEPARRNKAAPG